MKFITITVLALSIFAGQAQATTKREISRKVLDVNVPITEGQLDCTADMSNASSRLFVLEAREAAALSAQSKGYLEYESPGWDCPDFSNYVAIANRLGNPVKAKLEIVLTEVRGRPHGGKNTCFGYLEEEIILTLPEELQSVADWSSRVRAYITQDSKEECAHQ